MKVLLVDDDTKELNELLQAVRAVMTGSELYWTTDPLQAVSLVQKYTFGIVFLDINMPDMDGITLSKKILESNPRTNIVFVTAHPEYAAKAAHVYFSGFFEKPITPEQVKEVLNYLRNPIQDVYPGLYVQCFGQFEVFFQGNPVRFKRSSTKELFAYLIHLRGAAANTERLCEIIWPDCEQEEKKKSYLRHLVFDLRQTLKECNAEDVFVTSRNSFSVNINAVACDLYEFLNDDVEMINRYAGEYMEQYEWALMPTMSKY